MAGIDAVANSLTILIESVAYPTGITNPSILGASDVGIMEGWPIPSVLDATIQAGNCVVSIYPTDVERSTTRGLGNNWEDLSNNGVTGVSGKETKRQVKQFQISIWAPDNVKRATLADAIDSILSDIPRITFPDNTTGNLSYVRTVQISELEKEGVYRRDLFYAVEYPTIVTSNDFVVLENVLTVTTTVR